MWYNDSISKLLKDNLTRAEGLNEQEAQERLRRDGENKLEEAKKKNLFMRFLSALSDRMTLVLMVAALISFITGYISGEGYADPIIILLIVMLNAVISLMQESRAEKSLEALKKMTSPETTVLREGRACKIPSTQLVKGDIFLLEKGDIVPCDGRLLESNQLMADESALTGESSAVLKDRDAKIAENAPISEMSNAVFASTHIISGRGKGIALRTGMETCVGEIAGMIKGEKELTPLQKRLEKLSLLLGNITLGICLFIFILSLLKRMNIGEMFMTSVSLSVAAIPEGLPAIVTVVLSAGVRTLAQKKAIVKRLPAVETLGCAQVICCDKTGTLTCNKMTVVEFDGNEADLQTACALCNNDSSPTELALTDFCRDPERWRSEYPRIAEIPFDSAKKYMVTAHKDGKGYTVYLKGAPDIISSFCPSARDIESSTRKMAEKALRTIAFAKYHCKSVPANLLSGSFEYIGILGIEDPPRQEAKSAVHTCKKAGIRTIMITGDHPETALAIAKKIGIAQKNDIVYTEKEVADFKEKDFERAVEECNVFARVTPSFKLKIVTALKRKGYTVAMTGDGVNDAPALKKADIGCAMGISGTEVAKASADMILTDDNFATVVSAVKEGRGMYRNIRRAVHLLLSCNIGELFTVFLSMLISLPSPLTAIQLLWINLTTDSLPAIALGLEKTDDSVMECPPIDASSPLFSSLRVARMVFEGTLIGTLSIIAFVIGNNTSSFIVGRTMCFLVLGMSQLFHSLNLRSDNSIFCKKKNRNPFIWIAFFLCLSMQTSVVLIPQAASLFCVALLEAKQWMIAVALSTAPLCVGEIYKRLIKR